MFPNVSCCIWLLEFVGKYLKAFGMSSDLENLEVYQGPVGHDTCFLFQ